MPPWYHGTVRDIIWDLQGVVLGQLGESFRDVSPKALRRPGLLQRCLLSCVELVCVCLRFVIRSWCFLLRRASEASAASAASCASEAIQTLYRPDGDEHGSQRLGVGNAFGLRDCSSLPSRVVAVVCPRLSAYVCGCVVVGERSENSLLRA